MKVTAVFFLRKILIMPRMGVNGIFLGPKSTFYFIADIEMWVEGTVLDF